MTNPLKDNYLVRSVWGLATAVALGCSGGQSEAAHPPAPLPAAPIPAAALAGQRVMLLPPTLVIADEALGWQGQFSDRRATLGRTDSVIGALLAERTPEVSWVRSAELRRAVQLSAGMAGDPEQLPLAVLRSDQVVELPDPLRGQLRNLAAVSRARFGLAPAALVWVPTDTGAAARAVVPGSGAGTAELTLVLFDTRLGQVVYRTVARGAGGDPWTALARAVKAATPGLP